MRKFIMLCALVACQAAFGQEQFCIPWHEGLPHHGSMPPTVDGYVGRIAGLPQLNSDQIEQGWLRSGLFNYAGGGMPFMEMRGVKHNNDDLLYLSFVIQSDVGFEDNDVISIVFDPGWAAGATAFTGNARRIDIQPVMTGVGAGSVGNTGGTGTTVSGTDIRTNRVPRIAWKKFVPSGTGGTWQNMTTLPNNADAKARSWNVTDSDNGWSVELIVPTTSAKAGTPGTPNTEWPALGTTFGLYANVINFCGASSCLSTQTPGSAIQTFASYQFTWPRTTYSGVGAATERIITGNFATVNSALNSIKAAWLGQAKVGNVATACRGLRFEGGASGIGVRGSGGTLGTTIDAQGSATNSSPVNTLAARLVNDHPTDPAMGIAAEFRIANWGVSGGPGSWDKIPVRPTAAIPTGALNSTLQNDNATRRVDVPSGGPADIWMQTRVLSSDGYCDPDTQTCPAGSLDAHSCIWVLLDSNQNAYISDASVRRNFDIVGTSGVRRVAEINAADWGKPAGAKRTQEFFLSTQRRFLLHPGRVGNIAEVRKPKGVNATLLRKPDDKNPGELYAPLEAELVNSSNLGSDPLWNFSWMINASRATTDTLTIGRKTFRIHEPAGTFGLVGQHLGNVDRFVDGLIPTNALKAVNTKTGTYRATVPNGKAIRFNAVIGALERGEKDPLKKRYPPIEKGPGR